MPNTVLKLGTDAYPNRSTMKVIPWFIVGLFILVVYGWVHPADSKPSDSQLKRIEALELRVSKLSNEVKHCDCTKAEYNAATDRKKPRPDVGAL